MCAWLQLTRGGRDRRLPHGRMTAIVMTNAKKRKASDTRNRTSLPHNPRVRREIPVTAPIRAPGLRAAVEQRVFRRARRAIRPVFGRDVRTAAARLSHWGAGSQNAYGGRVHRQPSSGATYFKMLSSACAL